MMGGEWRGSLKPAPILPGIAGIGDVCSRGVKLPGFEIAAPAGDSKSPAQNEMPTEVDFLFCKAACGIMTMRCLLAALTPTDLRSVKTQCFVKRDAASLQCVAISLLHPPVSLMAHPSPHT
jgi:hypothetical protein